MRDNTVRRPRPGEYEPMIYRQVSFEPAAFNRLKDYQRKLEATLGRTVTNGEALSKLILSFPAG